MALLIRVIVQYLAALVLMCILVTVLMAIPPLIASLAEGGTPSIKNVLWFAQGREYWAGIAAMSHVMVFASYRSWIWPRFMNQPVVMTYLLTAVSGSAAATGIALLLVGNFFNIEIVLASVIGLSIVGGLASILKYHFGGGGGAPLLITRVLGRLLCGADNYDRYVDTEAARLRKEYEAFGRTPESGIDRF